MAANKVKWGLCNVHYAIATIAANGSATYETPVALPGAVDLSFDGEGEVTKFRADNLDYWTGGGNTGYSGTLEMALFPASFKEAVLSMKRDDKNILYEDANAEVKHFALLFEFAGDQNKTKHVFYNCTASRPSVAGHTTEETLEPTTESIDIDVSSIYVPELDTNITKSEADEVSDATTYGSFYTDVYIPAPAST